MNDKELAEEAARWAKRATDGRAWVDAPERVPRDEESQPISLRLPKRMLALLREIARRNGLGYQVLIKRWLDDRIRAEFQRRSEIAGASIAKEEDRTYEPVAKGSTPMEIDVGTSARFADGSGAFAHIFVVNKGAFAQRVRCWLRFERLDGTQIFPNEMVARWSCAPEPICQIAIPRKESVELVFIPDPSLLPVQSVADFATLEGHAIAIAVKRADGSCWGFTPESYFHQFQHPTWRLPNERIRVTARVLVNGKVVSKGFELDCSAALESFGASAGAQVAPASHGAPAPILPTDPMTIH